MHPQHFFIQKWWPCEISVEDWSNFPANTVDAYVSIMLTNCMRKLFAFCSHFSSIMLTDCQLLMLKTGTYYRSQIGQLQKLKALATGHKSPSGFFLMKAYVMIYKCAP